MHVGKLDENGRVVESMKNLEEREKRKNTKGIKQ